MTEEEKQRVLDGVLHLRDVLHAKGVTVSDRQWRRWVRVVVGEATELERLEYEAEAAYAAGNLEQALAVKGKVALYGYDHPDEAAHAADSLHRIEVMREEDGPYVDTQDPPDPYHVRAVELHDELDVVARAVRAAKDKPLEEKAAVGCEASGRLHLLQNDATHWRQQALSSGRRTIAFDEVLDRIKAVKRGIYTDLLGIDSANLG